MSKHGEMRARRKQVLALTEQGLTQSEIALRLGVSAKTVFRDLKRLRPYTTRLINQQQNEMREFWSEVFAKYSFMERCDLLGELMLSRGNNRASGRIIRAVLSGKWRPKRGMVG